MKVRCGPAEGARKGGRDVQQQKTRGQKKLWGREQGVELSRLVLGFVRQRKRLPDTADRGFWKLCHDLFNGAFTNRQVQSKVRYLHLRFRSRLSTNVAAKTSLRVAERQIFQIWTFILQLISPSSCSSAPSHCTSSPPSSSSGPSHCPSSPPPAATQAGVNEMCGHARVHPGRNRMGGHTRVHPGVGPATKGGNSSGAVPSAARHEPQETSTCSTEFVDDYHEEFNSYGQNNAARGQAASSGSDDDEFAHNNLLLHHLTVADLAAAVKTLAEIVARGPAKV